MTENLCSTDKIRALCRKYKETSSPNTREKLIGISRGRDNGSVNIVGENGADRDDAITSLAMTIGGPW